MFLPHRRTIFVASWKIFIEFMTPKRSAQSNTNPRTAVCHRTPSIVRCYSNTKCEMTLNVICSLTTRTHTLVCLMRDETLPRGEWIVAFDSISIEQINEWCISNINFGVTGAQNLKNFESFYNWTYCNKNHLKILKLVIAETKNCHSFNNLKISDYIYIDVFQSTHAHNKS